LTAGLLNVDLLILASDINGLYTSDPKEDPDAALIAEVRNIAEVKHLAGTSHSTHGTGGMQSKLIAGGICMWIVNGAIENFAVKALNEAIEFTRFL